MLPAQSGWMDERVSRTKLPIIVTFAIRACGLDKVPPLFVLSPRPHPGLAGVPVRPGRSQLDSVISAILGKRVVGEPPVGDGVDAQGGEGQMSEDRRSGGWGRSLCLCELALSD